MTTQLFISACASIMFVLFIVRNDSNEGSFCHTQNCHLINLELCLSEINIEQFISGSDPEMLDRIYSNKNYKKALNLWLPFLNKRGFLDRMIVKEEVKAEA